MIKDRRVVLRMNLSQFRREIKQNFLVKMHVCFCLYIVKTSVRGVFLFLKARLRTHGIAHSYPYFLGSTLVIMVVVMDVQVVVVVVLLVIL